MELDLKDNLEKYADMSKKDLFNDLRTEENEVLYENLIKKEIGFSNHCTETGSLLLTYYFKLNNQTKAWLSQFKTDYDLNGLEDLAFYKNGKIMFSSCTHERFHTDLSKK